MSQPVSKYELIFTATISGALIGSIFGCFILVIAQIDYHTNNDMLFVWLASCAVLFALVGARKGYLFSQNELLSSQLISVSKNKGTAKFSA